MLRRPKSAAGQGRGSRSYAELYGRGTVCLRPRLYRPFLPILNPENVGARALVGVVGAAGHRPLLSGDAVVRFEELIGSRGGDDDVQERTIRAIYDHLGMQPPARLSKRLFSSASPAFRKGRIGQWRESFDPALEALFEHEAGRWMEPYGCR